MGRSTVPDDWTPDRPHPDRRREAFAQRIARGESGAAAYRATSTKPLTEGTSKSNALRMRREVPVAGRIEAIAAARAAAEDSVDAFGLADLAATMRETTEALEKTYQAAEQAGASPVQLSKIRRALSVHGNRVNAALEEGPSDAAPVAGKVEIPTIPRCTCGRQ